jgi:ABC-type glutathione transport system ATPase component
MAAGDVAAIGPAVLRRLLALRSAARFVRARRSDVATPAISLTNVSKLYKRYGGRQFATLKSALLSGDLVKKLRPEETFQALKNVSFDVATGQTMGVIGRNGSGKSTR